MARRWRMIVNGIVFVVVIYALVGAGAYLMQRRLMYFPDTRRVAPQEMGLSGVEEVILERPDGARLVSWFAAPEPGRATVLYFHGNAGSVATRAARVLYFTSRGYGILFPDYRGYGGSTGSPSEAALVADGEAALDALVARGIAEETVVLFGESLGSGIAVPIAARRDVGAVILEAPFTSATDIAAAAYPFLPVRWLLKDRYESIRLIGDVDAPLLIAHGTQDRIIPVAHGRALFEAANEPKEFLELPSAGHNDLDGPELRARVEAFIARSLASE